MLEELGAYADRGVFPRNRHFRGERRPTFIDDNGVLCAVAHLLDLTGQGALALEVRDTHNVAIVAELTGDPRFVAWARAAGFTLEELAVVQPAYCEIPRYQCVCENAHPLGEGEALAIVAPVEDRRSGMIEVREVVDARFELSLGVLRARAPHYDGLVLDGVRLARLAYIEDLGLLEIRRVYSAIDGGVPCAAWASPALWLSRADLVHALLSAGPGACREYLTGLDARWADTGSDIDPVAARCWSRRNDGEASFDTRSCAVSAEPAPALAEESLVVLAALLAALAARRAWRSRRA